MVVERLRQACDIDPAIAAKPEPFLLIDSRLNAQRAHSRSESAIGGNVECDHVQVAAGRDIPTFCPKAYPQRRHEGLQVL
jgi:hypothetical protein